MKSITMVYDKILKIYPIPKSHIKEFNTRYNEIKILLKSSGPQLAGRIEQELDFTHILQETKSFSFIVKCMTDYINTCADFRLIPTGHKHLEIINCWVNDMKEGEYNPPHIHHDAIGYSTVLFLKVPEFINDAKEPHKFKDGMLGFSHSTDGTEYFSPHEGDFYIFEARHQHLVLPFKTKIKGAIRRSMSFNFIIKNLEEERDKIKKANEAMSRK